MNPKSASPAAGFEKIRRLNTCTVSNAIKRFNVRLRNDSFVHDSVHLQFPHFLPMLGYAATARIHAPSAPMADGWYYNHVDWWGRVLTIPKPRVIVVVDINHQRGIGAFAGEIHARIALALDCVGCATKGAPAEPAAEDGAEVISRRAHVNSPAHGLHRRGGVCAHLRKEESHV